MLAVIALALGLLTALAAQWVALDMAGAGHGWIAPVYFSMPLFLLYPAAFIRALRSGRGGMALDLGLLVIALALDLLLLRNIFGGENPYFIRLWGLEPGFVALWLALWSGWQALVLAALVGNRHLTHRLLQAARLPTCLGREYGRNSPGQEGR